MFILYGTRAPKLKERPIQGNTTCPHCQSKNSFIATTYGKYFHVFWIPFMPLFKTTLVECSHCKKTYDAKDLPPDIKGELERLNAQEPVKRPLWHGCGCLLFITLPIILTLFGGIIGLSSSSDDEGDKPQDIRKEYLDQDIDQANSSPTYESDSISYFIKNCVGVSIQGIDTERIKYLSRINGNKLLVILKVGDMKGVKKSSRKELVFAVEECIEYALDDSTVTEYYIGIDGNWNMLMTKTPFKADLGGNFADSDDLLPFYDDIEATKAEDEYNEANDTDTVVIEEVSNVD